MANYDKNPQYGGTAFNNTPGRLPSVSDYGGFGSSASLEDWTKRFQTQKFHNSASRTAMIGQAMGPGLGREIDFYNQNTGRRLGALDNAFEALDPKNMGAAVDNFGQSVMGSVAGNRDRIWNLLKGSFGNQRSLKASAGLSAVNQAQNQIGQFRNQVYNPLNLYSLYMQQAGALGAGNTFQGQPYALQAFGSGQMAPKSPTLFETAAGLAGGALGGGWKPKF